MEKIKLSIASFDLKPLKRKLHKELGAYSSIPSFVFSNSITQPIRESEDPKIIHKKVLFKFCKRTNKKMFLG